MESLVTVRAYGRNLQAEGSNFNFYSYTLLFPAIVRTINRLLWGLNAKLPGLIPEDLPLLDPLEEPFHLPLVLKEADGSRASISAR